MSTFPSGVNRITLPAAHRALQTPLSESRHNPSGQPYSSDRFRSDENGAGFDISPVVYFVSSTM
jgi:hypothetical protein